MRKLTLSNPQAVENYLTAVEQKFEKQNFFYVPVHYYNDLNKVRQICTI